ncbi:MAG: exo-alpha-sialidase, partial [Planctomycetota bacterium]
MFWGVFAWTAACTLSDSAFAQTSDEATVEQQPVFVSGTEGYHTFRIPSILVTKSGTVLAFCEGRKNGRGDSGNIDLVLKRSEDGGRTFGRLQVVWDDDGNTCGNPCAVQDPATGRIFLFMTHNLGEDHESEIIARTSQGTRTVWLSTSDDDGRTWSPPVNLTKTLKRPEWTWYATGPGCGIATRSGRLVIPCDHIVAETKHRGSHVVFSDDHGETWHLGGSVEPAWNECEVVELSDGALLLNMRNYDRSKTCRAVAVSRDGGATWSSVRFDEALPEPICQASIRRYCFPSDDRLGIMLFSNPADARARVRMTLRASFDDCKSWPVDLVLWEGPSAYSCLAVREDGTILCLYERGKSHPYETITLARVPLSALLLDRESRSDVFRRTMPVAAESPSSDRVVVRPKTTDAILANPDVGWETFHHTAANDRNLPEWIPSTLAYARWGWG